MAIDLEEALMAARPGLKFKQVVLMGSQ